MEEQNQEVKKVSKKLKIIAIIAGVLVILYAVNMIYAYIRIQRGDVVKWEGAWYTKEELAQKFPPQYAESVAKNTPEEVYATFRQALLDNNLELALEQMTDKHREEYGVAFQDKVKFDEWVGRLPEKITKEEESGNYASYDIDMKSEYKHTVRFFKAVDGIWKIESI